MDQAEHYDTILRDYEDHYYDSSSMAYRRRYIYRTLFDGLELNGKSVVELACGSGFNTTEMLARFPHAQVTGLDISPKSCAAFTRNTGREAIVFDLTASDAPSPGSFDCAFVVGGLHHCVRDLPATVQNLRRLVKPGGLLLMVEPNAGYVLNAVRRRWYKADRWFQEADEAPLHHGDLAAMAKESFEPLSVSYLGGPAYFLILNSLIVRLPLKLKAVVAPLAFAADDVYNRLPGGSPFPMFIARWRRRDGADA